MGILILACIFLLPLVFVLLGVYLFYAKKAVWAGRVITMLGVVPLVGIISLFGMLTIAFSGAGRYTDVYLAIVAALGFLAVVLIGCALWGVLKKKAVWIPLCVCAGACIFTILGCSAHQSYLDNLPTVSEGRHDLTQYIPYTEGSKVAELDEESTLTLQLDLPVMDGATALYPVYAAFAKAVYPKAVFEDSTKYDANMYVTKLHPYLQCRTTTGAYDSIVTGDADIIFVAAPSEEQTQFAKDMGVELVYTPIGREAFVFFVNSKNPIDDITLEQVQDIYSGKITAWDELGVHGLGGIRAFQRDEGSGSQSALIRLMDGKELMTPPQENRVDGMGGIITQVSDYKNFRNAIGYSFRFYSTQMVSNNQIKLLKINGVAPTLENIENGTYPIASEFFAVTRKDATENTKKLLDWILSEQGQSLIEKTGYTQL